MPTLTAPSDRRAGLPTAAQQRKPIATRQTSPIQASPPASDAQQRQPIATRQAAPIQAVPSPRAQARPIRPRASGPAPRVANADFGLDPLFTLTRDALVLGHLDTETIALWNPAAEKLFGYSADEAIGRPIHMLMPPAVARLHRVALEHYRTGGDPALIGSDAPIEVQAVTKAGDAIRVEFSLARLDHTNGERYVLAMLRDGTQRHRADAQSLETTRAEAARAEAEAALKRLGARMRDGFAALERPLAHLQRSAARLARHEASARADDDGRPGHLEADTRNVGGNRAARGARIVELRTEALVRATRQFADRAALDSGTLAVAPERLNLVPLLQRVVAAARARAPHHRLVLSNPQGLTVLADPRRIEQVFADLVEHAVRRSPRGTWIDVELRRPLAAQARLVVRDYGRSMAPDQRSRALDVVGADPALVVCRALLEQHGGQLAAEHPTDGGLRLVAILPAPRGQR